MVLYRKDRVKCDFYGKWKFFFGWYLKIYSVVFFIEIDIGMEIVYIFLRRKIGKCF